MSSAKRLFPRYQTSKREQDGNSAVLTPVGSKLSLPMVLFVGSTMPSIGNSGVKWRDDDHAKPESERINSG